MNSNLIRRQAFVRMLCKELLRMFPQAVPMKQCRLEVAERFGIEESTAHKLIHKTCQVIQINKRVVYVLPRVKA